jgi:hypothetical protein
MFAATTARAAETLVVTVEVGRGQPLTSDEVREAVAKEVGGKVVRAGILAPGEKHDVLVIDVDQGQARRMGARVSGND